MGARNQNEWSLDPPGRASILEKELLASHASRNPFIFISLIYYPVCYAGARFVSFGQSSVGKEPILITFEVWEVPIVQLGNGFLRRVAL
jgi:hypothetical protein